MFESPPPPLAPPSPAPEGDGSEEEVTPVVLLLGATMLLVSMLLAHTLKRHDVTFVTESGVAMLIGLLTGWVAWLVLPVAPLKILRAQALHDLIYYAMLPPLIFVAGYTMRKRHFFQNFFTILLLAVPGTLIAALAMGFSLYALITRGVIASPTLLGGGNALLACLLFGCLIASTDPVATLSILKEMKAPTVLSNLIFGESALNDAVSIVIFNVFRTAAIAHADSPLESFDAPSIVGDFVRNIVGAVGLGAAVGVGSSATSLRVRGLAGRHKAQVRAVQALAAAERESDAALSAAASGRAAGRPACPVHAPVHVPIPSVRSAAGGALPGAAAGFGGGGGGADGGGVAVEPEMEVALQLIFATGSYVLAEALRLSGILALFVAAIVMRHYGHYNLSPHARTSAEVTLKALAQVADTSICFTLGLAPFSFRERHEWDFALIGASLGLTLAARALAVFPLLALANCCLRSRRHVIGWRMAVVVWFAGLRGAIAFALAITLDETRWTYAPAIVTSTLVIILFTNLVVGPLTKPLLRCMDLAEDEAPGARPPLAQTLLDASGGGGGGAGGGGGGASHPMRRVPSALRSSLEDPPASAFHQAWRLIDDNYLKPYVGGQLRAVRRPEASGGAGGGGRDSDGAY